MSKSWTLASVILLSLLALAPLELAQTSPAPAANTNTAWIGNSTTTITTGLLPATATTTTSSGFGGVAGTFGGGVNQTVLDYDLSDLLATVTSDAYIILNSHPSDPLIGPAGGFVLARQAYSTAELNALSEALREALASESAASKRALAAHPSFNFFTDTGGGGRRGSTSGDIPTPAEFAALNQSLRNLLSKYYPDAKKIFDANPGYQIFLSPTAGGRRGLAAAPLTTGRGSVSMPGGDGLGGPN